MVSLALAILDLARGPTFLSESGALYEALLFIPLGGLLGRVFAGRLNPEPTPRSG